jgi:preprotein translocase subunit YajC
VIDLAYAMAPPGSGAPSGPGSVLIQLAPIILVLGIFVFLIILPQQRERKKREEMLRALKKGDRVVTSGGLVGTIVSVADQTIQLKIADSVRVECLRSAVTGVRTEGKTDGGSA